MEVHSKKYKKKTWEDPGLPYPLRQGPKALPPNSGLQGFDET